MTFSDFIWHDLAPFLHRFDLLEMQAAVFTMAAGSVLDELGVLVVAAVAGFVGYSLHARPQAHRTQQGSVRSHYPSSVPRIQAGSTVD